MLSCSVGGGYAIIEQCQKDRARSDGFCLGLDTSREKAERAEKTGNPSVEPRNGLRQLRHRAKDAEIQALIVGPNNTPSPPRAAHKAALYYI